MDVNPLVVLTRLGRQRMLSNDRDREIEMIVTANNAVTALGKASALPVEVYTSRSTVSRDLKRMGYTRKRLKPIVA